MIPMPIPKNWYQEYMDYVARAETMGEYWAWYMKTRHWKNLRDPRVPISYRP